MADTTDTTNERLDEMLLEAKKQTRYLSIIYGLAVAWTVAAAAGAFIAISIAMDSGS